MIENKKEKLVKKEEFNKEKCFNEIIDLYFINKTKKIKEVK